MLGDPTTLVLDEPVNGLDPEGVKWVRTMVRYLASEGRTVFLSSHLMSEMAQTADQLLVIGRGRIIASGPVQEIIDATRGVTVRVRSPRLGELSELLAGEQVTLRAAEPGLVEVVGRSAEEIGDAAAHAGIPLHELTPMRASLEDAYMALTQDEVEYRSESASEHTAAPEGASR
jgi:ABC-2 type transport system ATP-binding protein